jgi:hypothetical protein
MKTVNVKDNDGKVRAGIISIYSCSCIKQTVHESDQSVQRHRKSVDHESIALGRIL